ncbi:MAG: molybdopterin cofactor-binding domain-containing protein, partial [Notoacmeibacter sp.]
MGLARRAFLIGSVGVAGALIVGWRLAAAEWVNPLLAGLKDDESALTPYVKISANGVVTAIVPYAEMGQGVSTTLAALVAEELDIALADIQVEHGPASGAYGNREIVADISPFTDQASPTMNRIWNAIAANVAPMIGLQVTGSSTSTRDAFERMRQAAATARAMLVEAASLELNVASAALVTSGGRVIHQSSGRSLSFGELAVKAAGLALPSRVKLKQKDDWAILGKPQPRKDGLAKVTGAAVYGIDVSLPDMLYGTVKMAPRFGAKLGAVKDDEAKAVKGFQAIIKIETAFSNGIAVIADNTWAAFQAAEALDIDWLSDGVAADDAKLDSLLSEGLKSGTSWSLANTGDATDKLDGSTNRNLLTLDYTVPPLAHATMEPMNATAQFSNGKLTIWAPTQAPSLVRLV